MQNIGHHIRSRANVEPEFRIQDCSTNILLSASQLNPYFFQAQNCCPRKLEAH